MLLFALMGFEDIVDETGIGYVKLHSEGGTIRLQAFDIGIAKAKVKKDRLDRKGFIGEFPIDRKSAKKRKRIFSARKPDENFVARIDQGVIAVRFAESR